MLSFLHAILRTDLFYNPTKYHRNISNGCGVMLRKPVVSPAADVHLFNKFSVGKPGGKTGQKHTLPPFILWLYFVWGWSGGAMVLGKLPVQGRPTIWVIVGQGPFALAVGADGGCLGVVSLLYPFFSFSLSLGDGPI